MIRRFALGALTLALAACSLAPTYERPASPVAQSWPAAAEGARQVSDVRWRNFYTDPRLQVLIGTALENNRDLRIAVARVAEARGMYGVQQADRLPNANLNVARNASSSPASTSITGREFKTQRYDVNLGLLSFELDFWGRVANLSAAAKAQYLATEAAQTAFRLSLIADVANAYLSGIELDERVRLAAETVRTRVEIRELVARRRAVGMASELDWLQAEGAYQSAQVELAGVQRQQAAARTMLDVLVGRPLAQIENLPPPRSLAEQDIRPDLIAGLPAEVLLQRPDVMAAEQRLIAANANIGAARAAFLPKITLTGTVGTASRTLAGLFDAGSGAWTFQPALVQPLFDAGRNSANVDIAGARKVVAVADYEKTLQLAFREVADLLSDREKLGEQLAAQQANAMAQQQRLKLVEARYRAGLISQLELLDAQRDTFTAEQAAVQMRRQVLANAAQLYKALAGGRE
jgi:multidrug efflux system outer membrane protein